MELSRIPEFQKQGTQPLQRQTQHEGALLFSCADQPASDQHSCRTGPAGNLAPVERIGIATPVNSVADQQAAAVSSEPGSDTCIIQAHPEIPGPDGHLL